MAIIVAPPQLSAILKSPETLQKLLRTRVDSAFQDVIQKTNEDYIPWHQFRYVPIPMELSHEEAWALIKLGRHANLKKAPFTDKNGAPFLYWIPDGLQKDLHAVDVWARENLVTDTSSALPGREQFVIRSLMDEAIASSQLEGAATTTPKAKELLRTGRTPKDRSEQMILNNWETMQFIREKRKTHLTKNFITEIHQRITENTLDHPEDSGRLRTTNNIIVEYQGETVHIPPDCSTLSERMDAFCEFANKDGDSRWIHPVIKAAMLHFWLAYDHPFHDGNGRTARALMYWYLLSRNYLLFEYLAISRYIQRAPGQYVRAYLHTETDENDLTYFLFYNLKATKQACEEAQSYIQRKQKELTGLSAALRKYPGLNLRQRSLLSHAIQHPHETYTIDTHRNAHGIVYQTARTDLLDLAGKGFLKKEKRGKEFLFVQADKMMDKLRNVASA
ncbi:MAG TPA: Fic family protein [Nitrospira sp.]|nr:Fic family protein [Nitrospira sp.]HBR51149.1 Fic family protein [Nitrospira sp.]